MKITKIILSGFRAFDEPFELNLPSGKNLLLYGENGSGKSTIYFALKRFFEELGDDIQNHRNHFSPVNRDSQVQVKWVDATGHESGNPFYWDATNGHPMSVTSNITSPLRSMLIEGAHRAGFLDYRSMLRTNLITGPLSRSNSGPTISDSIYGGESSGLEAQLFDLASLVILAGVRIPPTSEGDSTLGALIRRVWENRPQSRHKRDLDSANAHANTFNGMFNAKLTELVVKLTEFLGNFENHQLTVDFQPVSIAWDKTSLELAGAELIPIITFRGTPITNYHQILNEARLSALATCMFLAGVVLSDIDPNTPHLPRFLVLDDALIGLEIQNRLPILRILSSDVFKHYQIFLLTHDRVWYDLARGHLPLTDGWLHQELLADDANGQLVPRIKSAQSELERARFHLSNGDLMAAAVYARAAYESQLRKVCEEHRIKIQYKKDVKKVSANLLWQGILDQQRERVLAQGRNPNVPDFIPHSMVNDIEMMRSNVLNQLSHTGTSGIVSADVSDAIQTIEAFQNHNFP